MPLMCTFAAASVSGFYGYGHSLTQIDVDVTPGQTFTASQTHASTNISRLFDDNAATEWGNGTDDTFWIQVQFAAPKAIWKYTLTAFPTDFDRMPISWTLKASNTGAFSGEEVTLDTQTGVSAWSSSEKRSFPISNTAEYLYYRLTGTAKTGALGVNEEYVLAEMEMMAFG